MKGQKLDIREELASIRTRMKDLEWQQGKWAPRWIECPTCQKQTAMFKAYAEWQVAQWRLLGESGDSHALLHGVPMSTVYGWEQGCAWFKCSCCGQVIEEKTKQEWVTVKGRANDNGTNRAG